MVLTYHIQSQKCRGSGKASSMESVEVGGRNKEGGRREE